MMTNADTILSNALQLPVDQRARLAAELIESLEDESENDAESAWDAEIARRLDELDSGDVQPVPWSEARQIILGTR